MGDYDHLRADPIGALQQIWAEIDTALDLDMVTSARATRVLLEGLKRKCELGLEDSSPLQGEGLEGLSDEELQAALDALLLCSDQGWIAHPAPRGARAKLSAALEARRGN